MSKKVAAPLEMTILAFRWRTPTCRNAGMPPERDAPPKGAP
jgi:hypothetical protein